MHKLLTDRKKTLKLKLKLACFFSCSWPLSSDFGKSSSWGGNHLVRLHQRQLYRCEFLPILCFWHFVNYFVHRAPAINDGGAFVVVMSPRALREISIVCFLFVELPNEGLNRIKVFRTWFCRSKTILVGKSFFSTPYWQERRTGRDVCVWETSPELFTSNWATCGQGGNLDLLTRVCVLSPPCHMFSSEIPCIYARETQRKRTEKRGKEFVVGLNGWQMTISFLVSGIQQTESLHCCSG